MRRNGGLYSLPAPAEGGREEHGKANPSLEHTCTGPGIVSADRRETVRNIVILRKGFRHVHMNKPQCVFEREKRGRRT